MASTKINDITVLLLTLLLFSCGQSNSSSSMREQENSTSEKDYIAFLISTDTLPLMAKIQAITLEDSILRKGKIVYQKQCIISFRRSLNIGETILKMRLLR
ncbi:hypothetical protein L950_0215765 [Sphingobacterium sp. IITKGP-BTPF85]|nr:hypothetical protein L950_0215765 [Sphingobacterium sp. IITKGP-BTPF85]